jgi:hypothetical protein
MKPPHKRFRCRVCSVTFSAWLPVPGEPDGALLLHHVAPSHPAELNPFLDRMQTTDDVAPVIVEAYEVEPAKDRKGDHMQERLKQLNTTIEQALAQLDALPAADELDVDDVATVRAGAEHLALRLRKIEERLGAGEEEIG